MFFFGGHFYWVFSWFVFSQALLLGLFQHEEELAEVALEEVFLEQGFLRRPVNEAAAVGVAAEVDGVDVQKPVVLQAEGDFEGFEAVVFLKAGDPVVPPEAAGGGAESRFVVLALAFEFWNRGRHGRHGNFFFFSRLRRSGCRSRRLRSCLLSSFFSS